MRHMLILLILLLTKSLQAQIFEDGFSDGNFTTNPTWSGNDSSFVVSILNGNAVLRLNNSEASTSYLSTPSTEIEGYWEFFIQMDGNAPSGSNKAEIILVSDNSDLSSNFNGYGVRVGETGDDFFRLVRYDSGDEATTILSDTTVFGSNGAYRVKVLRDISGNWNLEVGKGYNGELKNSGITGFDDTYQSSSFLGVKLTYTSSRTDDFYFDFKIDSLSIEEPNFEEFEIGDVLINEFLKDPPPGSGLPEYVEIVNTSNKILNLKNWEIGDNTNLTTISDTNFVLWPDTFLVLSNNPDQLKATFGDFFALDISMPALNNTSDQIRIYQENGESVDSLEYTPQWGGVDVALERRSLDFPATLMPNWKNSPNELGGTPGKENDSKPDSIPPNLASFEILNDSTFQLIFTEEIKPIPASNPDNYSIAVPVATTNQLSTSGENDELIATFFAPDTVILEFKTPIYTGANSNILVIERQEDVFGNVAGYIEQSYKLIAIDEAKPGDLVINEIMYDPPTGFSEFVEINVHVNKVFNLKGWTISDNSGEDVIITEEDFFIANSGASFERGLPWNQHVILVPDETINETVERKIVIPQFPTLNNSNDAIVIKDPNGMIIDSLTYYSLWGGKDVSLERRSPNFPSTVKENWGDHPTENLATPAQQNTLGLDETAPLLVEYNLLSDKEMELIFNEQLKDTSALTIEHFRLTNALSASPTTTYPTLVRFFAPDTILLSFEESFFEFNILEIANQTDFFGNKNDLILIDFEYVVISPSQANDVKITEFVYDAPIGFSEFVEIYNSTPNNFDVQGWTFADNSGNKKVISNTQFYLKAGEYLILAADSTLIQTFENIKLLDVSGFPALNNSTDALVLKNSEGLLMDSLTYTSSWGGDEVSLERKSILFSGIYSENWGESPSLEKGTPGIENEILPDTLAPYVLEANVLSDSKIQLIFNERLFGESALNPENYTVNDSQVPSYIEVINDSVEIEFDDNFEDGEIISIALKHLEDLFGNVQIEQIVDLIYVEVSEAEQQSVVINEILYRRKDALSPEFVELYNPTNFNFDLSGWTFSDAGVTVNIPDGVLLNAGEYVVLTDNESLANALEKGIYLSNFPSLNDSGDELVIRNTFGITIDSLFYTSNWGGDMPGFSVERKDSRAASSDKSNWATSVTENGVSAGLINSVYEEDIRPPEILFSSTTDSSLFIAFSEVVRLSNENEVTIEHLNGTISNIRDVIASEIWIEFVPSTSKERKGGLGRISISNLSDYKGNVAPTVSSLVAEPIKPGGIILNEILYNPLADNEDNLPDQTEYIELFNPTEQAISLEGIFLHDAPDEENNIRSIIPVSTRYKWLAPDSYVLIYSDDETTRFSESKLARYFELEGIAEEEVIQVDRTSLSLASTNDAIFLADSSGITIDSVFYDESWQNPNLYDTRGIAIEKIDPDGPSNDASNWSSSTHVSGGTPLAQNTIYQESGASPDANGISFSPNPFSPDDDGFEDNLFINYTLDAADYLLRVRIFDRYGREVRELVNNYQAGFEGSLIWDGLTDDRTRNRVGIYIVYFEAYDSSNGKDRTFKETVVLARKF